MLTAWKQAGNEAIMKGYEDSLILDRAFPFQINEVLLSAADSSDDLFHWHSYFEITCVLDGSGCYYVNGRAFEVGPGDLIIFNSAELHGWQLLRQEMKVLAMVFSPDLVAGYGAMSDMEYLDPFIKRGSNFINRIGSDERCAAEIAASMNEILEEWQERSEGYRLLIKSDVLRILTMLVRHYHNDSRAASPQPYDRNKALARLRPVFEYIDEGYCGRLTLKAAADTVFMSPNYFSHYFHTATGVSFSDYITMRRIRKAQRLLETTSKSIYEVAIECGFPNSSNFYRLYRKYIGDSPRGGR